jgi:iron-sulfur cluster repair protein YtfE (RIC family)
MALPTQPIRDEHRELLPHIDQLREVADRAGEATAAELRAGVDGALDFLRGHLLIHATAEERVLYPAVARAAGSPRITATMERDHAAIAALIDDLAAARERMGTGEPGADDLAELRRTLYGLHALVRVHFDKEEEVYLPLLDEAMTVPEVSAMYAEMEAAAGAARAGG